MQMNKYCIHVSGYVCMSKELPKQTNTGKIKSSLAKNTNITTMRNLTTYTVLAISPPSIFSHCLIGL